jgi:hypothetical protein
LSIRPSRIFAVLNLAAPAAAKRRIGSFAQSIEMLF